MTLPAKISQDELVKLDPVLQKEYVERGGSYYPNVAAVQDGDAMWALEDVGGLKRSLQMARKERDEAVQRSKAYGDRAPEEITQAFEDLERYKSAPTKPKEDEIRKSVEEALAKKYGTEITSREGTIKDLEKQLENAVVIGAARASIAKHAKTPESVELLLPHVLRKVGMKKGSDGTFYPFVRGKDGNEEMTRKGASTDPMSIEELVESMKTDAVYAPAFPGSGITGSGARGSNGAGGSNNGNANKDLSPVERLKAARRSG